MKKWLILGGIIIGVLLVIKEKKSRNPYWWNVEEIGGEIVVNVDERLRIIDSPEKEKVISEISSAITKILKKKEGK